MTTYAQALAEGRAALERSGVDTAALDARLLLAAAAGLDGAQLIARSGDPFPEVAQALFDDHLTRRGGGEPVCRIIGETEFFGLRFNVTPSTLAPRPETETLVDIVLKEAHDRFPPGLSICDLGTGSGAIVVALLSELQDARAVATDISKDVIATARNNAEAQNVLGRITFRVADFAKGPKGPFDIVVSNPPYVRRGVIAGLAREVRNYDPHVALDGGEDGLSAYRSILARSDELLAAEGFLAFEIGYDQGEEVVALCRDASLAEVRVHQDLGGRDRVVTAIRTTLGSKFWMPKKALGKVG